MSVFHNFSDENQFVVGLYDGHVAIWANSVLKSKKLFNYSVEYENATRVQYADNKVFAIGYPKKAKLHILDLQLNILKVADHQFGDWISSMASSESYVAIGEWSSGNVTVLDHNGSRVLVSYL